MEWGAPGTAECTEPSAALQTAFLKQHPLPPRAGLQVPLSQELERWSEVWAGGREPNHCSRSSSSPDGLRGNLCSQVPGLAKPESAKGKWSHHKEMGTRERQARASPHQRPSVAMRAGLGAQGHPPGSQVQNDRQRPWPGQDAPPTMSFGTPAVTRASSCETHACFTKCLGLGFRQDHRLLTHHTHCHVAVLGVQSLSPGLLSTCPCFPPTCATYPQPWPQWAPPAVLTGTHVRFAQGVGEPVLRQALGRPMPSAMVASPPHLAPCLLPQVFPSIPCLSAPSSNRRK